MNITEGIDNDIVVERNEDEGYVRLEYIQSEPDDGVQYAVALLSRKTPQGETTPVYSFVADTSDSYTYAAMFATDKFSDEAALNFFHGILYRGTVINRRVPITDRNLIEVLMYNSMFFGTAQTYPTKDEALAAAKEHFAAAPTEKEESPE